MVHRVTGGLRWIHCNWKIEGGLVLDLNGPRGNWITLDIRIHF